jgi:hypothetical protein
VVVVVVVDVFGLSLCRTLPSPRRRRRRRRCCYRIDVLFVKNDIEQVELVVVVACINVIAVVVVIDVVCFFVVVAVVGFDHPRRRLYWIGVCCLRKSGEKKDKNFTPRVSDLALNRFSLAEVN